ncbi:MAG: M50 family metallopeptidase [Armatimonadetes bacterium]|nr:M50 family metallopeptidase [Armatimonadota bacterium]
MKAYLKKYRLMLGILFGICAAAAVSLGAITEPSVGIELFFVMLIALPIIVGITFAIFLLIIAVHELGHVVAGKWAGFEFVYIQVGPFGWRRTQRGHRFFYAGDQWGLTCMVPPSTERILPRFRFMIMGGPVASAVFQWLTLAAVLIAGTDFGPLFESDGGISLVDGIRILLLFIAFIASIFAMSSIVPFRYRGQWSDGAYLLLSIFSKRRARRLELHLSLGAHIASGTRARDCDGEQVKENAESRDGSSMDVGADFLAYLYALDTGDFASAQEHIERAAETSRKLRLIDALLATVVLLEAAYAKARFERDAAGARAVYEEALKQPAKLEAQRLRALAAIQCAEGDLELAQETASAARQALLEEADERMDLIQMELEWIEAAADGSPQS